MWFGLMSRAFLQSLLDQQWFGGVGMVPPPNPSSPLIRTPHEMAPRRSIHRVVYRPGRAVLAECGNPTSIHDHARPSKVLVLGLRVSKTSFQILTRSCTPPSPPSDLEDASAQPSLFASRERVDGQTGTESELLLRQGFSNAMRSRRPPRCLLSYAPSTSRTDQFAVRAIDLRYLKRRGPVFGSVRFLVRIVRRWDLDPRYPTGRLPLKFPRSVLRFCRPAL
jgi:hypothetical protein